MTSPRFGIVLALSSGDVKIEVAAGAVFVTPSEPPIATDADQRLFKATMENARRASASLDRIDSTAANAA